MENAIANPNQASGADTGSDLTTSDAADNTAQNMHPVVAGFNKLSVVRQAVMLGGIALAVALTVAIFIWSKEPSYKPLINRLQDYNAQQILEVLQREGFEFQIDPSSQILMVRADELHDARLKLAAASLIDDKTVGLELLDNDSNLGTSHFIETARYRRGLEGELARTIASVQAIRNARVHLAIPKQSVFVRDHRKPRASVFLELYAGSSLHKDQVEAIVNLVSSSISEMDKGSVSVVDQKGNLLSKIEHNTQEFLATKQLQYTERVENSISSRVNSILKPVLGMENYKAEVSADIDFTVVEQSEETFNPDLIAVRSEQLINEQKGAGPDVGGIPGALSNQPPGEAEAPEQIDPATGLPIPPMDRRSETTRNYEVDRTLSYKQQQVGRINRLTVAVVINDKQSINPETGEVEFTPWSENEMARLEILVKDTVGFSAARGDSVNVINSPFMGKGEVELGSPDFWSQPWFWEILKQVLAGLFLLVLIFGVIRPTIHSIATKGRSNDDSNSDELADMEDQFDEDRVTLSGADDFLLPGASESFERQLDSLKGLIAEDPARVAQVMIEWINSDNA